MSIQKRMADPQIGPDPSAGSSPAFIRAHLAFASSYVKNAFTSHFLFALQISLSIRSSHIKQKESHHCDSITCWWSKKVASFCDGDEKRKYAIARLLSFGTNFFLRAMRSPSPAISAYGFSLLFSLWMMNCINTYLIIKPAALTEWRALLAYSCAPFFRLQSVQSI